MKKKLLLLLSSAVLLFSVTACGSETAGGSDSSGSSSQVVNDCIYDVTEQTLIEKTGIDLPAPKDAKDVTYNIIGASDSNPIAEMEFTLNGVEAFERAQVSSLTSLTTEGEDVTADDYNISGLYYTWDSGISTTVLNRDGWIRICKDAGVIEWLDAVPGILYNIGVQGETDTDTLQQLADAVFVPLQEDADGSASA